MNTIRIAGIVDDSLVDGEGLRTTVFTQGCSHACEGCHNPQTWDFNAGESWQIQTLLDYLLASKHKRVTFSGGDPFFQSKACGEVASVLREHGFNLWAYTGFLYQEILQFKGMHHFLSQLDVLVDGRFVLCEKSFSTPYRGSRNQRLIDVQASLAKQTSIDYLLEHPSLFENTEGIFI